MTNLILSAAAIVAVTFILYRGFRWKTSQRAYMRRVRERHLRTREDIAWAGRDREYRRALELRERRLER